MMLVIKLACSQTLSLWRAGALRVLVLALVLAVAAITAVSFFTQRVASGLSQQGGLMLGGDMVIVADHPVTQGYILEAQGLGLDTALTYEFPSMVVYQESNQLAQIKAVDSNFPLRGDLSITRTGAAQGRSVDRAPNPGEAWIEPRLASLLEVKVGDTLDVGEHTLRVGAILHNEPSRGGNIFSLSPRLLMNAQDLAATRLIQYGSRVRHQLVLAGDASKLNQFQQKVKPLLKKGERIETVRDARPEIKSALDKAQQFLGLSAMVSVILAMVAMLLASMPFVKQSLNSFAVMRCFGAQQKTLLCVLATQTLIIAFFSALIGVLVGFIVQLGLAQLADNLFLQRLPQVSLQPVLVGIAVSLTMLTAVVLPHAWQMRKLSAVNILRLETLTQPISAQAKFLPAAIAMMGMVFWQAGDMNIALATVLVMAGMSLVVLIAVYGYTLLAGKFFSSLPAGNMRSAISFGVQGLKRRLGLSAVQMVGFSLGLMVLMLLALVHGDLLRNWQASLPEDAPNRFVINIQPDQIESVSQFFASAGIKDTEIFPMVRARLTKHNQQVVNLEQFETERAKRLAEREFNLSWATKMQSDNQLVSGKWWTQDELDQPYLSLEQGLAESLGIQLGDTLVFDVAGIPMTLKVTNLRKVQWDTMRANFFAVTPPDVLNDYPASYISSFHLPAGRYAQLNQLVKTHPNLTVIDTEALLQQIRTIINRMSSALAYVFAFSLVVGLSVLYAALVATRDERVVEATLLRVFGASRRQVNIAYITEFASIGLLAAVVASVAANLLAYFISIKILGIPFEFNLNLALLVMLLAATLIPMAAWLSLRGFLNVPPRQLLNSI
ncbi:MAG: FtsX-like permease family protein [Methylotenera sp.]|nr:FtsX-like permease family protein [Methylotenera sp.]